MVPPLMVVDNALLKSWSVLKDTYEKDRAQIYN